MLLIISLRFINLERDDRTLQIYVINSSTVTSSVLSDIILLFLKYNNRFDSSF